MALFEGKVLDDYELRRLVGKGGIANVYDALDLKIQQKVAVKVFKREDEELLRRFMREASLMESLRHKHLVPIIDSGQYRLYGDLRYYIVMPFFDGGTLRVRIRRSSLSLQETCKYLEGIALALDYIHRQGIIHRDIKASNILLNSNEQVFLTYFGIARIANDATHLTSTGDVLGAVDYVAPELFGEHRRADASSDLYSLGISLFSQRITATITPLKNWTSSPALRQGYAANNTLQVIAQGSSLSLNANGEFLVQLIDSTYTISLIAFFATTDGVKQADVVYGNLKVYPMS